jgi:hypothetical protein
MDTTPAPVVFPTPKVCELRHNIIQSEVTKRIALLACRHYMAGQLVIPDAVELVQLHITHNLTLSMGRPEVEYRYTFQAATGIQSRPFESWLVVVPCDDPEHTAVNDTTRIQPARFYVWDADKGWQHVLDYEHPYVMRRHKLDGEWKENPFDFPAA